MPWPTLVPPVPGRNAPLCHDSRRGHRAEPSPTRVPAARPRLAEVAHSTGRLPNIDQDRSLDNARAARAPAGHLTYAYRKLEIGSRAELADAVTYVVLRLDPGADEWLAAARAHAAEAPDPARALLAGRSRVELGHAEAELALLWASRLPGWDENGRAPLFLYTPGEILAST